MKAIGCRIHACLTTLFITGLFSSCTTTPENADGSLVRQRNDLEGRPFAAVSERLGGHPIYDHTSRASKLGGEFYTPINARFPLRDPASRSVFIREVRWERGDRYIAVFCTRQRGEWLVFNAVEWRKDIVF
jgi:hypothetical protein